MKQHRKRFMFAAWPQIYNYSPRLSTDQSLRLRYFIMHQNPVSWLQTQAKVVYSRNSYSPQKTKKRQKDICLYFELNTTTSLQQVDSLSAAPIHFTQTQTIPFKWIESAKSQMLVWPATKADKTGVFSSSLLMSSGILSSLSIKGDGGTDERRGEVGERL